MKSTAKCFDALREYIETIPLFDCHDHTEGPGPKYTDAIEFIVVHYMAADITSSSSDADFAFITDQSKSLEERWPVLEKAWNRTLHTGYAKTTRLALKEFYGVDKLTLESLKHIQDNLLDLEDEKVFTGILDKAGIAVRLEDMCGIDQVGMKRVMDGTYKMSPKGRLVISLPRFHAVRSYDQACEFTSTVNKTATCLDEYIDACREIFEGYKRFGAVAFKDQSAYTRSLKYSNPTKSDAEKVFNYFMEDPRRIAGYPDQIKPLDDYLFHEFMRMARDMDLPVQVHTGHMARVRDDIAKTNAVLMNSVFELHRDVRFDLFHANWPYSAELLYLAKNHPNVTIDFCWANIIDPIYCQNMFKQALSSVPHGKIHGYGSDFGGSAELAWAHSVIARDNIAIALADMVEIDYLSLDEAKEVAYAWLFGNANEYYRLGL
ncbi:MAG: amidohydrolase family protein [Sedimentisphaeraceae bacterium JB056]